MINLYVMNVSPFEDSSLFSKGLSLIDEERQSKVNNLKRQDVKRLSLGAGLILLSGLNHFSNQLEKGLDTSGERSKAQAANDEKATVSYELDVQELIENWDTENMRTSFQYTYGIHGKPYVNEESPIFFSLSHSGDYVLLAVSDREIGADIQQRKDADYERIARHFMTQAEYELWVEQEAWQQKELFYQIWAGKEAYLKLTGEGMTAGFQTVYLDAAKQTMVDVRAEDKGVATQWFELEEYQIAICQFT